MSFTYFLPGENNIKQENSTESNSIVIIGANGSGKSKLGAWIEKQALNEIHRIGGQRSLNFNENISLKNYREALDYVFYGSDNMHNKIVRWGGNHETTTMLNDFEYALAAFLALKHNDCDKFLKDCREAEVKQAERPEIPCTVEDKLIAVWNTIFPHRNIVIDDSKFYALVDKNGKKEKYFATEMSDGERAVLYLIVQVLCIPYNKTLIIDEPELHLHRSIMSRLWKGLEQVRPDCLFIYITHDTEFAALHSQADKIWVKSYDGITWQFEKLTDSELPEALLLEILGSRKPILFVEGEKNSLDTQLYTELYPQFHVIACGSCTQVIVRTKVFQKTKNLHGIDVYGIIDRDYRTENEIDSYKKDNIFTIDVAEVENLFLVEELIKIVAKHEIKNENEIFETIKKYILNERLKKQIDSQICQSVVADIKYRLQLADISSKNESRAKDSLNYAIASLDYDLIKSTHEEKFQTICKNENYADILKFFNEKCLANSIGQYFGKRNDDYCPLVLRMLQSGKHPEIVEALAKYLPPEIA